MTKINREEYEILKELIGESVKWICRDEGGDLFVYEIKPNKGNVVWLYGDGNSEIRRISNSDLFQFIQWEDEKPYNVSELIEEYEEHEFYDYVGWEYYKKGEAEVRKDIGWLKREIHKELEDWHGVEGGIDGDGINEIMLLINQFEESKVKQLERKIKELDSYNDELIRDNNQFRNAMDNQEVLSEDWIDEYSNGPSRSQYVWVDDLKELLVPKQEDMFNGETPEEEQKYRVLDNTDVHLLCKFEGEVITVAEFIEFSDISDVLRTEQYNLTEKEIKDYDERYFAFAKPVEEVEG